MLQFESTLASGQRAKTQTRAVIGLEGCVAASVEQGADDNSCD